MKIFKNGLLTGLMLQLAIGPVFFFIINLTLQKTIYDGLAAVLAVTLVDYLYITLTILGVGQLIEKKKIKKILNIISSIVLVIFGVMIGRSVMGTNITFEMINIKTANISSSFVSAFLLAFLSPMTIIFWTSLFAAKATENNYSKKELPLFGLGMGLATLVAMGLAVILFSLIEKAIPIILIQLLNVLVGCLLVFYGLSGLFKILIKKY